MIIVPEVIESPGNFSVLLALGPPDCVKYLFAGAIKGGRV
jgi:hypothetical protein